MAAITFKIELDSKVKKTDLQEIRIRITQNRKHKRFNVGYAINIKHWNAEKQQVRTSHPLATIINAAISTKVMELEKEYLQSIPTQYPITIQQLYKKAKSDILGISYLDYYQAYIDKMPNASTAMGFQKVLNKLKTFLNGKDLHFVEITFEFIQDFLSYLKSLDNSQNTIHHNFKTLRSIYNHAVKERRFTPAFVSPFYGQDVNRKKVKRQKLDSDEISRFENYEVREGIQKFHAKNFFLLSYYLLGVRSSSMIMMRWSNIVGDRCIYQPAKGQDMQNVKISKKAQEILEFYKKQYAKQPVQSDFIFPFMRGLKLEGKELVMKISAINTNINNQLKEISIELGLNKKITTHVARHSFAYNARIKSDNDIYAVKKALGHSSIVITEAYFEAEENNDSDKLNDLMFD